MLLLSTEYLQIWLFYTYVLTLQWFHLHSNFNSWYEATRFLTDTFSGPRGWKHLIPKKYILGGVWLKENATDLFIVGSVTICSPHSLREQLADLYQTIHSSANMTVLQQYEEIIHSLIDQSLDNRLECEQLETSLKR